MTFLHWIGDTLRFQLQKVPLSTAHWMFVGLFLALMFWIVQLPSTWATPNDRKSYWYEDLRIWSWLTLICQIIIYSVF